VDARQDVELVVRLGDENGCLTICFRASMPPKNSSSPRAFNWKSPVPGRRCTRAIDVLRFPVL